MTPHEPKVSPDSPVPNGYGFLKKGNVFLTGLCRRKTHAANKTLYVVIKGKTPQGLRAPKWILGEVFAEDRATREKRQAIIERRDGATQSEFEKAIRRVFPKIPEQSFDKIVQHTLKKRSGRVGRAGTLDINDKVHLSVAAHVRHCHTEYELLMRRGKGREAARREVHPETQRVLQEWRGGSDAGKSTKRRDTKKKDKKRAAANMAEIKNPTVSKATNKQAKQNQAPGATSNTAQLSERRQPSEKGISSRTRRTSARLGNKASDGFKMLDNFFDDTSQEDGSSRDEVDQDDLDAFSDFIMDDTGEDSDVDWLGE